MQAEISDLEGALVDCERIMRLAGFPGRHAHRHADRRGRDHIGIRKITDPRARRVSHDRAIGETILTAKPVAEAVRIGSVGERAESVAGVVAVVGTAQVVPQLVRDHFGPGDVGVFDDGETIERIGILGGCFEHVAEAAARRIHALQNQADQVGPGFIADRVDLVHLTIRRLAERIQGLALNRQAGADRFVVAHFGDAHEPHPGRDSAGGEIAVGFCDGVVEKALQRSGAGRARQGRQYTLGVGKHYIDDDARARAGRYSRGRRGLRAGRSLRPRRRAGRFAPGEREHRIRVEHGARRIDLGTRRHEFVVDFVKLRQLGGGRAQRIVAQLHVLDRGVEEAVVVGEQHPALRPALDRADARKAIRAERRGFGDHDLERSAAG